MDKENGDSSWNDAVEKEINALLFLDCLEFKGSQKWEITPDFQYAP
jgi:hypothetical protein